MRDILFRGKSIDKDEWIYGDLRHIWDIFKDDLSPCIVPTPKDTRNNNVCGVRVIPETIGQYTGLTDKNGTRIFEGDIIPAGSYIFVVKFGKCGGVNNVKHEVGYTGFYVIPIGKDAELFIESGVRTDILYWLNAYDVFVIGNICDNPELLEAN